MGAGFVAQSAEVDISTRARCGEKISTTAGEQTCSKDPVIDSHT